MYLHFGQNSGKSSSTVCDRICVRVLPPRLGQQSQSVFTFAVSDTFITSAYSLMSVRKIPSRSNVPAAKPGISLMDLQILMLMPVRICPISPSE